MEDRQGQGAQGRCRKLSVLQGWSIQVPEMRIQYLLHARLCTAHECTSNDCTCSLEGTNRAWSTQERRLLPIF